jgi:cobalamin synthase
MWGVTTRVLLAGTVAGAAAGMMMAAVEMIYGWASSAHTAWDAPMGIWAYIGGLNHFGHPANHIWPIVLGIGGHMMNAIVVGLVFVALLRVLRNPPGALLLGAAYGAGLWALQRYVFLPINTPEDRLFTTGMISPQWVWWVAHITLGTTLGLVYLLFGRWRLAARAPHRLQDVREPHLHKAA